MTRLFGVIGYPIGHSLSPVMQTAALRALRLEALYTAFEVPPRFLSPILRALILSGVEGLNVTVPLKEQVLPLMDRLDPTAKALGAVNTILIHNRRTSGYNTDGVGFTQALRELGYRSRPARAALLGAGGAARAVAWELTRTRGSRLTIANRHLARAQRLARWISLNRPHVHVRAVPLKQVRLDGADLLVNATTVGMRSTDGCPIDPAMLRRGLLVYDLVYHRDTPLVQAARRRGCVAATGLSMLLYQGAESFRLWWERPAPLAAMRRALEQAVESGR
jgi:shikimate dehydrogenase